MGFVHAEITLKNAADIAVAKRGLTSGQEIRQATVTAVVDTGAITLVITEQLRQQLGLGIRGERKATLANNTKETLKIADPVWIRWKNRDTICQPLVIPGDGNTLLGLIPLEDMDLIVDPGREELVGAHGDEIVSAI